MLRMRCQVGEDVSSFTCVLANVLFLYLHRILRKVYWAVAARLHMLATIVLMLSAIMTFCHQRYLVSIVFFAMILICNRWTGQSIPFSISEFRQ